MLAIQSVGNINQENSHGYYLITPLLYNECRRLIKQGIDRKTAYILTSTNPLHTYNELEENMKKKAIEVIKQNS
jgi:hypothetical protein